MKITPQARKKQLIEAGVYDAKSLELNLQGSLSQRQKIKLMIHSFLWFFVSTLNIVGLVILVTFQILYFRKDSPFFFWMIALGVFGFLGYLHAEPFWKDIQADKIKTVSGSITKRYYFVSGGGNGAHRGGNSYFLVHVHHIQFSVSPTLYSSLTEGGSYRLFYAPNSGWVLNVDTT